MNKAERVRAALAGNETDRPPFSFWTHLPGIDHDPDQLADETARFCREYDLDFIKSMPNGLYCVEDWGCECDYSDIERGGIAKVVSFAVNEPDDWLRLENLDVRRGAFGRELRHLDRLVAEIGNDTPVLATAFSPLTIAQKLSGGAHREHLLSDPDKLASGLEIIAEVTVNFVREALVRGCAGVFFATQEATFDNLDEHVYRRFARSHDDLVMAEAARGGWFNVLHMHGENIMFDMLKDYEICALNWHIGETPPSIADYRASGGTKPIVGGLQRSHITNRDLPAIMADLQLTLDQSGGRGILVSPACVIRYPVDTDVLQAVASAIKALATNSV